MLACINTKLLQLIFVLFFGEEIDLIYYKPRTIFIKRLYSSDFSNFDTTKKLDLTDEVKNELTNANQYYEFGRDGG